MTTVAAAIAKVLSDRGTERVFGLLGSGNLLTVHHLVHDHGIPFHNSRHEGQGVGAADGYARATGRVGVCTVTQGPAYTNTFTALVTAHRAHTPLVLLAADAGGLATGDRPTAALQAIDQDRPAAALGLAVRRLDPAAAVRDLAAAFDQAHREQRPVVVNVPADRLRSRYDGPLETPATAGSAAAGPDREQIVAAAQALARARRPVVRAGHGAVRAGAAAALRQLAVRTGALLTTTLRASALFAGDDYDAGISGGFAAPGVAELFARADCLAAFGTSLNDFTTDGGRLYSGATVIHCDRDLAAVGRHRPVDVTLVGDAAAAATALVAVLPDDDRTGWRDHLSPVELATRRAIPIPESPDGPRMDPRPLCASLDALLPEERTVITDGGLFALVAVDHVAVPDPYGLVWTLDFLATGGGLGAAVGAALGRPDRLAVLFIGDGGMLMTLGDLDTAVRDRVRLLVIVLNDEAYGAEVQQLRRAGLDESSARFATPDLAVVARAMGADGMTVHSIEDLEELRSRLDGLDGPLVVDAHIESILPRVLSGG